MCVWCVCDVCGVCVVCGGVRWRLNACKCINSVNSKFQTKSTSKVKGLIEAIHVGKYVRLCRYSVLLYRSCMCDKVCMK